MTLRAVQTAKTCKFGPKNGISHAQKMGASEIIYLYFSKRCRKLKLNQFGTFGFTDISTCSLIFHLFHKCGIKIANHVPPKNQIINVENRYLILVYT